MTVAFRYNMVNTICFLVSPKRAVTSHQHLQLVESFRNDSGKVRTRVVANLGRLDQIAPKQLDPLINGLNWAMGRAHNTSSEVHQEPGLSFGGVLMLHELPLFSIFDKKLNAYSFCSDSFVYQQNVVE